MTPYTLTCIRKADKAGATAARQPAFVASDGAALRRLHPAGVNRAQDYDPALFLLLLIQAPVWLALLAWSN